MPLPGLQAQYFAELARVGERFMAANRVGIVVGLVLTPLMFGGLAIWLGLAIPEPFGMIVGGSIGGAGLLLMLFLLWYRKRTFTQSPFAAWATITQWRVVRDEYGTEALSVDVYIEQACPISEAGYGVELMKYRGQNKTLVVTSRSVFETVHPGQSTLILCMPTTEVVAIDVGGQLVSA
jgi:hypothetical protein